MRWLIASASRTADATTVRPPAAAGLASGDAGLIVAVFLGGAAIRIIERAIADGGAFLVGC